MRLREGVNGLKKKLSSNFNEHVKQEGNAV